METIFHVQHNRDYVIIKRDVFENAALSWGARGVLGYLLTKPDGWQVRFDDLIKHGPAGRDAMRRMIAELEAAGHLTRERKQDAKGRFYWHVCVYEEPVEGSTIDGFSAENDSIDGFSADGESVGGKPTDIVNIDYSNSAPMLSHMAVSSAGALDNPPPPSSPATTSSFKKEKKKAVRKRDPALDTPACRSFRDITGRWPRPELVAPLLDALGTGVVNDDLLKNCYRTWCARGYNPMNIAWATEWYVNGGPPKFTPKTRSVGSAIDTSGRFTEEDIRAEWERGRGNGH